MLFAHIKQYFTLIYDEKCYQVLLDLLAVFQQHMFNNLIIFHVVVIWLVLVCIRMRGKFIIAGSHLHTVSYLCVKTDIIIHRHPGKHYVHPSILHVTDAR